MNNSEIADDSRHQIFQLIKLKHADNLNYIFQIVHDICVVSQNHIIQWSFHRVI